MPNRSIFQRAWYFANQQLYGAQDASGRYSTAEQVPSAIKADNNAQQLLDAFKRGAGLSDCRYPEHITPEMMFMVGQMLGASVQGCMDLLGSRAAAKQEVRMAVTLINEEANNPLKFLPTGASALAQDLWPENAWLHERPCGDGKCTP